MTGTSTWASPTQKQTQVEAKPGTSQAEAEPENLGIRVNRVIRIIRVMRVMRVTRFIRIIRIVEQGRSVERNINEGKAEEKTRCY